MDSRTRGATITFMVLALAAFTIATSARGQTTSSVSTPTAAKLAGERTRGFMLDVHTVGATGIKLTGEDFEDDSFGTGAGAGAGVMIGYGFNRTFSTFVSLDVAKQRLTSEDDPEGTFGLVHLEIGARANLPLGGSTVPYVLASVGRRGLGAKLTDEESGESANMSFHGKMIGLGAGVEHFFSPTMSLDAGVHLGFGKFDQVKWNGLEAPLSANSVTSTRVRVGVTWRP